MDVYEAIKTRFSVRAYTDQNVEEDKLRRVLDAGRLSPSARNRQERKFVVVQDDKCRNAIADASDPSATLRLMLDPPLTNPMATGTAIRFAARGDQAVTLDIIDVAGRRIDRVASYPRGDGTIRVAEWDARGVASGVYFAVLRSGRDQLSRRLVVVR